MVGRFPAALLACLAVMLYSTLHLAPLLSSPRPLPRIPARWLALLGVHVSSLCRMSRARVRFQAAACLLSCHARMCCCCCVCACVVPARGAGRGHHCTQSFPLFKDHRENDGPERRAVLLQAPAVCLLAAPPRRYGASNPVMQCSPQECVWCVAPEAMMTCGVVGGRKMNTYMTHFWLSAPCVAPPGRLLPPGPPCFRALRWSCVVCFRLLRLFVSHTVRGWRSFKRLLQRSHPS